LFALVVQTFIFALSFNLAVYFLSAIGSTFILIPEVAIYSLKFFGLQEPALGWLISGLFIGGTLGFIKSLKSTQQHYFASLVKKIALTILLIFALSGILSSNIQTNHNLLSQVVLEDNFQPASYKWQKDNSAKIEFGGLLHKEKNFALSIWGDKNNIYKDVDLSVNVKKTRGDDNSTFGIIARYNPKDSSINSDNFYYLLIKGKGEFTVGKYPDSSNQVNNIGWHKSSAINTGDSLNNLRIVCYKSKIIAWINNQRVGVFEDSSYIYGRVGLVSAKSEGNGVAVYFDNVVIKTKPKYIE
jgi:hypothetical protein